METKYQQHASPREAIIHSKAVWLRLCRAKGVTPSGIANGTETMDVVQNKPVFPPFTTGHPLPGGGVGYFPVVIPDTGTGAATLHKRDIEMWDGDKENVPGEGVVTIVADAATAKTRSELPLNLREKIESVSTP